MKSISQWFSSQIRGYVAANMPSWNNLPGNVTSGNQIPVVKPEMALSGNFIHVALEGSLSYVVEDEDAENPALVKPLFETGD